MNPQMKEERLVDMGVARRHSGSDGEDREEGRRGW